MSETAAKHTPGPWTNTHGEITGPNRSPVAACRRGRGIHSIDSEVFFANARLIAAAPDMLAALQDWSAHFNMPGDPPPELGSLHADMLAAIAKAEGRTP